MKKIDLKGGLGNQLFQYAYGRTLELQGRKIVFDTSFYHGGKTKTDSARDFKLDNFSIETKAEFSQKNYFLRDFLNKVLVRLRLKKNDYYQSEKYFKDEESNIRKEFTLRNPLSVAGRAWQEKIKATENSVSLHIRRGDYVQDKKTNAFHGTCDMEYYTRALEKITEVLKNKNLDLFVFSDDVAWVKDNMHFPYPMHFVSDPKIADYEEMFLMSLCKYNIIANSTFSWWSAWLNPNPEKIVVAPTQWFANKTSAELKILPQEWLTV